MHLNSPSYESFAAQAWDGGGCILFDCGKQQAEPAIWFLEMILYYQEDKRVRTTQEFQNGNFAGINFIEEIKTTS